MGRTLIKNIADEQVAADFDVLDQGKIGRALVDNAVIRVAETIGLRLPESAFALSYS